MNPETSIPPTKLVRRASAQRWHLAGLKREDMAGGHVRTRCGQTFRIGGTKTAYNASQITCNDCLVAAVTERS